MVTYDIIVETHRPFFLKTLPANHIDLRRPPLSGSGLTRTFTIIGPVMSPDTSLHRKFELLRLIGESC